MTILNGVMYSPLDMNRFDILNIGNAHILDNGTLRVEPSGAPGLVNDRTEISRGTVSAIEENNYSLKLIESKLTTNGLDYKVTSTATGGGVLAETQISDAGITTTGDLTAKTVVTKKWKVPTPDYVFEPGYKLRSLAEVEAYVKAHKHLPDVPSALEMDTEGIDVATMNMRLLKQIEQLHLYVMEQEKRIKALETGAAKH